MTQWWVIINDSPWQKRQKMQSGVVLVHLDPSFFLLLFYPLFLVVEYNLPFRIRIFSCPEKMLNRKCKILNRKYRIYYLISLFLKVFPVIFVHLLPFLTTKFWKITKVYFLAWIVLKKGVIDAEHNVRQLFANNVRYTYLCVLFLFRHDEIGVRGGSTFRLIGILSWHIFRSEQFSRDKCNPLVFNEKFRVRVFRVGLIIGLRENLLGGALHHFFFSTSICFLTLYHW